MKIKKITSNTENEFYNLAKSHGSVFSSREWLQLFDEAIEPCGIFNKKDNMIGGFILYRMKRFGFTFYMNPPYTPVVGPFLKIESQKPLSIMNAWKDALTAMSEFLETLPYSIIILYLAKEARDMQPFFWKDYKVIPQYTYLIELDQSIEVIHSNLSTNHKRNIKAAEKKQLEVNQITDLAIIKDLVMKSYEKQKIKVHNDMLDKILFQFANEHNSFAFAAFKNGSPVSASFFVHDKTTCYDLLNGNDHENKDAGAGVVTLWEAIKHAKQIGLKSFDFEGSMIPNIEQFYRGFGGRLTSFYSLNKAKLPLEIALKLIKRNKF